MAIRIRLDVVLAERQMKGKELAEQVGITEQNLSLLRTGKVKGLRFTTLDKICQILECQPGDILSYIDDDAN
ncbi:helix-turn-helix domain-containing protein [Arenicella xantha]|uniref:Xre family transcriptional regulator n=1 Tax=Arenicella xantha TaxID=644221 RepID=A0A395JLV1_9GAMM|nr:helix-turn-helix transcriptional regulator [Arenicella xantha]RBP51742.1 Xre family transcriptional regulator [Arenicella xantha]